MLISLRTLTLALLALAVSSSSAHAVSSLSLIWADTDSATITVSSTTDQLIRADIKAVGDTEGIGGIFISFAFDADLKDELNIGAPAETPCSACGPGGTEVQSPLPGMGNDFTAGLPGFGRNQTESGSAQAGLLGSYDVTASGTGLISATRTLGSIFFTTNALNVVDDGVDVDLVVLNDTFDAVLAASGADISSTIQLNGASVNSGRADVPEASTTIMMMAGLAGLLFAGSRH